jgi:hypothetical protein
VTVPEVLVALPEYTTGPAPLPEGRTGAHRLAVREQELEAGTGVSQARQELLPQTRLADAGGAQQQGHLGARFGYALVEHRQRRRQLALAAPQGSLAEHGGGRDEGTLAAQHE